MSVYVSSWVWKNTKTLKPGVRLVLIRLADMANDEGFSWPSISTMADDLNKTPRQIISDIAALVCGGLLAKESRVDATGRTTSNLYRIVMETPPVVARVKPTSPSPPEAHFTLHPEAHFTLHPEAHFTLPLKPTSPSYSESSVEPSKEEPTPPYPLSLWPDDAPSPSSAPRETIVDAATRMVAVNHVFEVWKTVMKHPAAKLTPGRVAHIKARLKDGYTVEDLSEAVRGCARSPFHMGENATRTVYDDLVLICRNGEKVEMFKNMPQGAKKAATKTATGGLESASSETSSGMLLTSRLRFDENGALDKDGKYDLNGKEVA